MAQKRVGVYKPEGESFFKFSRTIVFRGKRYVIGDTAASLSSAKKKAKKFVSQGYKIRIIPAEVGVIRGLGGYAIYKRL